MEEIYSVKEYTAHEKDIWDSFIQNCPNATFLHLTDYFTYHQERFPNLSLLVYKKNELKAVLPFTCFKEQYSSHGGLTYGGLLFKSAAMDEQIQLFHAVLQYLHNKGIEEISYRPTPNFYHRQLGYDHRWLIAYLQINKQLLDVNYIIKSADWTCKSKKRNHLKKAKKEGLIITEFKHSLKDFWQLLTDNLWNKYRKKVVHSLEEISLLKERFPEKIKFKFVYQNDTLLAGAVLFETQECRHLQYSASSKEGQKLYAMDYLIHHCIESCQQAYWSFGISTDRSNGKIVKGLKDWKEGWGAHAHSEDSYLIKTESYTALKHIYL